ncbi:MAG: hypothetical protein ACRD4M_05935 [Candidatus Acidiferrales bacterium]
MVRVTIRHIENYKLVREYCHHCAQSVTDDLRAIPAVYHERATSKETDSVLEMMKERNVPLTRENYLAIAYWGNPPEEIDGEIEASIPWEIKYSEDIALMAQMGVRWEPNDDED